MSYNVCTNVRKNENFRIVIILENLVKEKRGEGTMTFCGHNTVKFSLGNKIINVIHIYKYNFLDFDSTMAYKEIAYLYLQRMGQSKRMSRELHAVETGENNNPLVSSSSENNTDCLVPASTLPDTNDDCSECPRCGFVRQRYIPDDHTALPDVVQHTVVSSSNVTVGTESRAQTDRNTSATTTQTAHQFPSTNDFTSSDKDKINQMSVIAPQIQVVKPYRSKKTMICSPIPQRTKTMTSDINGSPCVQTASLCRDSVAENIENLKNEQVHLKRVSSFTDEVVPSHLSISLNKPDFDQLAVPHWHHRPDSPLSDTCDSVFGDLGSGNSCASSQDTASACSSPDMQKRVILRQRQNRLLSEEIDTYTKLGICDLQEDLDNKNKAFKLLGFTGMFYGDLSMVEARKKLKKSPNGTFLLRKSSNPEFLMSLSVKTPRGTTSIRIRYKNGTFRLDCEESSLMKMRSFDCIMKLLQHYSAATSGGKDSNCVFLESSGRKDTPVLLTKPYLEKPSSLKHMCRLTLNKSLSPEQRQKWLKFEKPDIEQFMNEYPYIL